MSKSHLEDTFAAHLAAAQLPPPVREYRFAREVVGDGPGIRERLRAAGLKDWRFDFAWPGPGRRVAVEVEGGVWSDGRHTRGSGFTSDCEKYNAAALLGWCVLRVTGVMIDDGRALDTIERALLGDRAYIGEREVAVDANYVPF